MDNINQYKMEQEKVKQYELLSQRDMQEYGTEIAYRDLNSRYDQAEEQVLRQDEFAQRKQNRLDRKLQIENAWHQSTSDKKKKLEKGNRGNAKEASYYQGYSLKEMEIFIKSSDRGGNSQLYNDVATDLEVYNRVMGAEYANPNEGLALLRRLQESCNHYLATRKKTFWRTGKGKVRRAMIEAISIKVNQLMDRQTTMIHENRTKTKNAYLADRTDENVNAAMKAHYDLIYQVLQGNMTLSDEELKKLDLDAEEVMKTLMKNKVDPSQSDSLCTRFFNALGWSGSKARLVNRADLNDDGEAMKTSPIKKRMYHSMKPIGNNADATDLAEQLAGTREKDNRLYYGMGRFGKGIYTSSMTENETSSDSLAYMNSWAYGNKKGSVMMTMTLNEYARIVTQIDLLNHVKTLKEKFPKVYNAIIQLEHCTNGGYSDYYTMFAALFGYNTIHGTSQIKSDDNKNGQEDVAYYTTTDRKAFTIAKQVEIRLKDRPENEKKIDYEYLNKYELGNQNLIG